MLKSMSLSFSFLSCIDVVLQSKWPNYVILRSSVIFGASPKAPLPKTVFLDFVVGRVEYTSFATEF